MIINSNEYFNKKIKWNKVYKIVVVKNNKDIEEMISYFLDFIKLNSIKKSVGLDFEFNSSPEGKKIALFQINLESDKNDAKIYLFYPPDLKDTQLKILINLLTNPNVKKILHGAESLDIPYLFKNIFINDDLRNKFCNNLFDTRYMCEYFHIENNFDNKCKIYSLMHEMNVIDDKQLEMLLKNEEDMGPIYLIEIDVRNLNEFTMLYSAFDVLYLPALLDQFPKNKIYQKLIPELTCFNYIDRYENIFTKPFGELVAKVNNYFLIIDTFDKNKVKMIDIFQMYYAWINGKDKTLGILMDINYFKKFIEVFIKFIVYKNVLKNYNVWENNNSKTDQFDNFIDEERKFQKLKLTKNFEDFFSNISQIIKKDINR
jgi:hypothetical protein